MKRPLLTALSAIALLSASARADGGESAGPAEAKKLFDEGVRLMDGGDYEHARVKFAAASGIGHSASITWNLAVCELHVGRVAKALRHFREYARDKDALPNKLEEAKTKFIPQAQAQVAELRIDADPGATITVDGKDTVGTAPLPDDVAVDPGKHVIDARRGAEYRQIPIDVAKKQVLPVNVRFVAPEQASAPAVAASAPPAPPPSSPEAAAADEERGIWPPPFLTLALGGVAVATGVTGVLFSARSSNQADTATSLRSQGTRDCTGNEGRCGELRDATDASRSAATTATVFYVVSGASLVGAAVVWAFFGPKQARSAWVAPSVSPNVAQVTVGGTF